MSWTGLGVTGDVSAGAGSYTQHEFELRHENIQGQIRGQKIRQAELQLEKERVRTRDIGIEVQIAEVKLDATKFKLAAQQFKTEAENHLATQAKYQSLSAQVAASTSHGEYEAAKISANLRMQVLGEDLRSLDLSLGEKMALNDNKREELSLKGVLQPTGQNISFRSLMSDFDL